jgi:hypothetical protein
MDMSEQQSPSTRECRNEEEESAALLCTFVRMVHEEAEKAFEGNIFVPTKSAKGANKRSRNSVEVNSAGCDGDLWHKPLQSHLQVPSTSSSICPASSMVFSTLGDFVHVVFRLILQ